MPEETQEHDTTITRRSSEFVNYPIDTFTLWDNTSPEMHCQVIHNSDKVKLTVWSEQYETHITKTIVGGDPEEFTIEDSLFLLRDR